jgi:hypothetical protein
MQQQLDEELAQRNEDRADRQAEARVQNDREGGDLSK